MSKILSLSLKKSCDKILISLRILSEIKNKKESDYYENNMRVSYNFYVDDCSLQWLL
ncbi:hypothetical protein RSTT_P1-002 (plasmid) [Candidatus Endomicrobiellum trichonymphae]|nr:hypothetical protein RSTT_P1-002 [Candidatus Endomicrobium trichonymphae]